jgi:anti-anti-sigma regulatory factor
MVSIDAVAPAFAASVVVDLIGDLDATLGTLLAETLVDLSGNGTRGVLLTTKHVTTVSNEGLTALDAAVRAARANGLQVALDAGNRKLRTAFEDARIAYSTESVAPQDRVRHYMFAHHELPKRARAGAAVRPL